jgi:hypothetical protein
MLRLIAGASRFALAGRCPLRHRIDLSGKHSVIVPTCQVEPIRPAVRATRSLVTPPRKE